MGVKEVRGGGEHDGEHMVILVCTSIIIFGFLHVPSVPRFLQFL
jgi:hypothetical protein